jgi:sugar lactone lactonase YvrE
MKVICATCIHPSGAVLGEGPLWHRNQLWWVDIERCEIHAFDPAQTADRVWTLPDRVSFIVPQTAGGFLIGLGAKVTEWDPENGIGRTVANPEGDFASNRFNDAKCDPLGRLWAGTMSLNEQPNCGNLYRIDPVDFQTSQMVGNVSISNGLAWSPDGSTMYYIDSTTRRVDAFDFDAGQISNRRCVIKIAEGFPDGMCSDRDGNLWIALWGGWGVVCHDPKTGEIIAKIELPVEAVTSCCFDDKGGLFITTARRGLDAKGQERQPLAGGLFYAEAVSNAQPVASFG